MWLYRVICGYMGLYGVICGTSILLSIWACMPSPCLRRVDKPLGTPIAVVFVLFLRIHCYLATLYCFLWYGLTGQI